MTPILSIVIPTKDRYETLFPVLKFMLKYIKDPDYEIVVQDNSKSNDLANKEIELINDSRIKYFYSSLQMDMSANSNLAISNSSGHYITFIGDDDAVSPYILDVIVLMTKNNVDCLFYTPANYYWPGVKFIRESYLKKASSLQLPKHLSSQLQLFKTSEVLDRIINTGAYGLGNMPRLYHGIVSRKIMLKVKEKFGSFVPGSCPDMAISAALAFCTESHYFINYPVTITGVSKNSAAGLGAKGAHIAKIEDVSFLPKNIVSFWDPNIPQIWTGPTIYAQNVYEVLSKLKERRTINYIKMYEYLYVFFPSTRSMLSPLIQKTIKNNLYTKINFFKSVLYWEFRKLLFLYLDSIKSIVIGIKQFKNIDSIDKCGKILLSIGSPLNR